MDSRADREHSGLERVPVGERSGEKKPFTVADSIEMTALADPAAHYARFSNTGIKRSPDGRLFFVVTRKGNLLSGANEYRLLVYETKAVQQSLSTTELPKPIELTRFATTSNRPGIGRAKWLSDSTTIAFLGENPGEQSQVYTVDVTTKKLRKLSSHPTSILDYDVGVDGERFVYTAMTPFDWSQRFAHGFAVGTESIIDVMGKGHTVLYARIAHYSGHKDGGSILPVDLLPYKLQAIDFPWGVWVSPNGRWAIVLQHVPEQLPALGARFRPEGAAPSAPGASDDKSAFVAPHPHIPMQYFLVNLETGHAEPAVDAPAALYIGGTELKAYWLADSASFILSNTMLPFEKTQGEERAHRRTTPAMVEVDVATRTPRRIADVTQKGKPRFAESAMNSQGQLVLKWSGDVPPSVFEKRGSDWVAAPAITADKQPELVLSLAQAVNQSPEIRAADPVTGTSKLITDLNPQFRNLSLGEVETLTWKDASGTEWTGGLLKPTNYRRGQRYPLVIQTHGYYPDIFLVDGADGCMAGCGARALANRGIMVVQMKDIGGSKGYGTRAELDGTIAGYRALIDELDNEGLIDRSRVGLHGWSRTGYYVQHALAFSDLKLAAVSVSDASQLSTYFYPVFFGVGEPGMTEIENMMGAPLWGDENAKLWAEHDPSFHLSRVNTPLRIEAYEWGFGWWDMFVILRRNKRPVEYLSFPDATHNPSKPWERLTSQGGTVDWYDFWLNGHEDPDPTKTEQYKRWRELRGWKEAAAKTMAAILPAK